jgi:hypothetical protein
MEYLDSQHTPASSSHFSTPLNRMAGYPFTDTWLNKVVAWIPYLLLIGLFVSAYIAQTGSCGGSASAKGGVMASIFVPRLVTPRLMG